MVFLTSLPISLVISLGIKLISGWCLERLMAMWIRKNKTRIGKKLLKRRLFRLLTKKTPLQIKSMMTAQLVARLQKRIIK